MDGREVEGWFLIQPIWRTVHMARDGGSQRSLSLWRPN